MNRSQDQATGDYGGNRCSRGAPPRYAGSVLLLAVFQILTGCATEDPQMVSLRQKLVLPSEPPEATSIAAARAHAETQGSVVLAGQVAADAQEAFIPGKATFLVTEILADLDHGPNHDADNCPFCKRRAAEAPRAAIEFADKDGMPLRCDARKLFNIEPGDQVVIRGHGEWISDLNLFRVSADGIYVRRGAR
jgi:hypothetical protein